jgi:hypothetical protein
MQKDKVLRSIVTPTFNQKAAEPFDSAAFLLHEYLRIHAVQRTTD